MSMSAGTWRVAGAAVRPAARATPLHLVLAGPVVGSAILVCAWWLDAPDMTGPLVAAALFSGCTLGYALDDPAASTTAPAPFTLGQRRALIVGPLLVMGAALWWAQLRFVEHVAPVGPLTARWLTLELLAFASIALGLSALGSARLDTTAGGTIGALGLTSVVALLFLLGQALPTSWPVPSLVPDTHPERWWWVVGAGVAVSAWYSRDPAGRRPEI